MGGRVDSDLLTMLWLTGNCTLRERNTSAACHASYWSEHSDKSRQIIWPHIKHRACSRLIEEFRIRMPTLRSTAHHECGGCDWYTNLSIVDELEAGLQPASQKGIGSAA